MLEVWVSVRSKKWSAPNFFWEMALDGLILGGDPHLNSVRQKRTTPPQSTPNAFLDTFGDKKNVSNFQKTSMQSARVKNFGFGWLVPFGRWGRVHTRGRGGGKVVLRMGSAMP